MNLLRITEIVKNSRRNLLNNLKIERQQHFYHRESNMQQHFYYEENNNQSQHFYYRED